MAKLDSELVKLLNDPSFIRWIQGNANPKETQKWNTWEEKSPGHSKLKRKAGLLYQLPMERYDGSDVEIQLKKLHRRIDENENIFRFPSQPVRSNKGYYYVVAAAAVLLIAAVGFFIGFHQSQPDTESLEPLYSTIETNYGEKGLLRISDGSSIWLNANSSLRYSTQQFNSSTIEVWLEGEAYFSITRHPGNSARNFIVHTPDGEVQVLGTRFNVNTRFRRTGVVLEEGVVEVTLKDFLQNIADQRVLEPGQRAVLISGESSINVQHINYRLYTAWMNGQLAFEETPLSEVLQHIEATYGVTFDAEDSQLLHEKISGSFRNPDLATLIKGLEEVFDFTITTQNQKNYLISKQEL